MCTAGTWAATATCWGCAKPGTGAGTPMEMGKGSLCELIFVKETSPNADRSQHTRLDGHGWDSLSAEYGTLKRSWEREKERRAGKCYIYFVTQNCISIFSNIFINTEISPTTGICKRDLCSSPKITRGLHSRRQGHFLPALSHLFPLQPTQGLCGASRKPHSWKLRYWA